MRQRGEMVDSGSPLTIAVLEDDTPTAELYQLLFDTHGYRSGIFEDNERCCQFIRDDHPDLLIFDVLGLTQNGLNVLAMLHDEYGEHLPPVIIATALRNYQISDHPVLQQVRDLHILYKPFDLAELVETIDHMVGV